MEIVIDGLIPAGRNVWGAQLTLGLDEIVDGIEVRQVCELQLRFNATADESGAALVEKAHAEAERVLMVALAAVRHQSPAAILEALYVDSERWKTAQGE